MQAAVVRLSTTRSIAPRALSGLASPLRAPAHRPQPASAPLAARRPPFPNPSPLRAAATAHPSAPLAQPHLHLLRTFTTTAPLREDDKPKKPKRVKAPKFTLEDHIPGLENDPTLTSWEDPRVPYEVVDPPDHPPLLRVPLDFQAEDPGRIPPRRGRNWCAQLHVRGFDPNALEYATNYIIHLADIRGVRTGNIVHLPTHTRLFTVIRAPHVHKASQENLMWRAHKRLVCIYDTAPDVVDAFLHELQKRNPIAVQIRAKKKRTGAIPQPQA